MAAAAGKEVAEAAVQEFLHRCVCDAGYIAQSAVDFRKVDHKKVGQVKSVA